jgi:hypothetical protein
MKKILFSIAILLMACAVSANAASKQKKVRLACSTELKGAETQQVAFPVRNGYIQIFNGTSLNGWRGYGKDHMPNGWTIDNRCLHYKPGTGEGGDIIFAHQLKNFELDVEWKISEAGNSGIFYLAQEVTNEKGGLEPIYTSAPEYQLLDNENHPDAKLGHDGNRKSASLYDMLPAKPQNANPYGQWNRAKIVVKDGKVTHYQNGVKVVEYQLWTPEWTKLLNSCKFSEKNWPSAFQLLNNCGGVDHKGFIGFQDHGNELWLRNISIKILK